MQKSSVFSTGSGLLVEVVVVLFFIRNTGNMLSIRSLNQSVMANSFLIN